MQLRVRLIALMGLERAAWRNHECQGPNAPFAGNVATEDILRCLGEYLAEHVRMESVLPQRADIGGPFWQVRSVP